MRVRRLPYRPPLDWDGLLAWVMARAIPGVEELAGGVYRRIATLDGEPRVVEAEPDPSAAEVEVRVAGGDVDGVARRVRRLFDLDADPSAIDADLARDRTLRPLVARRPGRRSPGAFDVFELTVRAILGQQVTVAGATTLAGRLARLAGAPLPAPYGTLTHAFPTPAQLAAADLSSLGVPGGRRTTLGELAGAVATGRVRLEGDPAQLAAQLLPLPGIGPWTVSYVAMRGLGDPDSFPVGDLGVIRAAEALGLPAAAPALLERAESWRPWRSYATHHLWASLGHARGG